MKGSSTVGLEPATAVLRRRGPGDWVRALWAVSVLAALGALSSAHAAGPLVPVAEAIALAQGQLQIRGLEGSVYIQSAALRSASILGVSKQWTVLWSEPLPASQGRVEVGVEVDMKGNVVRLLKKATSGPKS